MEERAAIYLSKVSEGLVRGDELFSSVSRDYFIINLCHAESTYLLKDFSGQQPGWSPYHCFHHIRMVPVPISARNSHSSRILCALLSVVVKYAPRLLPRNSLVARSDSIDPHAGTLLLKRSSEFDPHNPKFIVFAVLIPVLVLMSGLFAGLTLGYMSLDETQLNVLSISGTPYVIHFVV